MTSPFLVDTDIPIDYLRGHPIAIRFVTEHEDHIIESAMSVAELYAAVSGGANDAERLALADLLELLPVVPISPDIAGDGGLYTRNYRRSHGTGLADAIIAAMAVSGNALLKTLNIERYPMFDGLSPAYRK